MMLDIKLLRSIKPGIICISSYPAIIQSILDFDWLSGKPASVKAIIATGRKTERYFFGTDEIVVPVFDSIDKIPPALSTQINLLLNLGSGRRALSTSLQAAQALPKIVGGNIFAEHLPEQHALQLIKVLAENKQWIVGGSSVGLIIPSAFKLGAIGGVEASQLDKSLVTTKGSLAVISSSGGMVNELIRMAAIAGHGISFAVALGGERYPLTTPESAFIAAQQDPQTKAIAYFGELGGDDEYALIKLIKNKQVTKPIVCYIAGTVADLFEEPPQFGHAKALASNQDESATAKSAVLRKAGVLAATTFSEFSETLNQLQLPRLRPKTSRKLPAGRRRHRLIGSSISYDHNEEVSILGEELLSLAGSSSFANIAASMFLGQKIRSKEFEQFFDFTLRLLVDHGPYVSGALNTITTARAGRDLVSSLAAGLLTIGPRFGGAINESAKVWLDGVASSLPADKTVELFASQKAFIPGIGHKKYSTDNPDPRVTKLIGFTKNLPSKRFVTFAKAIEAETSSKKSSLILNVDGAIAAVMLDLLSEKEKYSDQQLAELAELEFFNSIFVLSRSVGLMAHFLDQKRLDEGLLRLSIDDVASFKLKD